MNLSEHFTIEEFTSSDIAKRRGFDNSLPQGMMGEAKKTADMMERIRAYLGSIIGKNVPILITSGYRCPDLNRTVGSSGTSDHLRAMAVDFKAPVFGTPYQVAKVLAPVVDELEIGQLIHEFGSWIHVSTRYPDKIVNRIITIGKNGTQVGIVNV